MAWASVVVKDASDQRAGSTSNPGAVWLKGLTIRLLTLGFEPVTIQTDTKTQSCVTLPSPIVAVTNAIIFFGIKD